jgi:hypothetical protein
MKQFSKQDLPPWQLEIINKYPIFTEFNPECAPYYPIEISDRVNLRFGFECGEGWRELIEKWAIHATYFNNLIKDINHNGERCFVYPFIIKEKLGSLHCQGSYNLTPELWTIWMGFQSSLNRQSEHICEVTGKYGKLRTDLWWIRTLCDEEYEKLTDEDKRK